MTPQQIAILHYINERETAPKVNIRNNMAYLDLFEKDIKVATLVVNELIKTRIIIPILNEEYTRVFTINKGRNK